MDRTGRGRRLLVDVICSAPRCARVVLLVAIAPLRQRLLVTAPGSADCARRYNQALAFAVMMAPPDTKPVVVHPCSGADGTAADALLLADGRHLSAQGHRRIGTVVVRAIRDVLATAHVNEAACLRRVADNLPILPCPTR